jgi:long-chain acyl-CoA synthetase
MTETTQPTEPYERMGFRLWAQADPDRLAVIDARGSSLTYGELLAEVNRLSHGLRSVAGIETGGTVACVMANSISMLAVYLAAMQSGVYFVTLNYHLTAHEIAYILEDSGADAVVCSQRFADVVVDALELAGTGALGFVDGPGSRALRPLHDLAEGQPETLPEKSPAGSLMQYTSGTTGRPKGVKRPLSGMDADQGALTYKWIYDEYRMWDVFEAWLVSSPMYHSANITPASGCLHLGGTLVLMEGWTPELFLEAVQRHHITGTHMVPTQFHRLLQLPDEDRLAFDVSSLRFVMHGAAPCSIALKRAMLDWLGPVLYEYYGSTEVGTTFAFPEDWLAHPGTVGLPSSISELAILDVDGNEVPTGEIGIVYMRQGEDVMEYHNDPDKTAAARRGRLLTVGDMGWVDDDGFLYLSGRAHDMVIVGGVNVYPAEIEAVLFEHPLVADTGVVGAPDEDLGEVPVAYVQLRPEAPPGDEAVAAIEAFCAERLAKHKRPTAIHVLVEMPRDPNGKLYKARLRELEGAQG